MSSGQDKITIIDLDDYYPQFDRLCDLCRRFVTGTEEEVNDHKDQCLARHRRILNILLQQFIQQAQQQQQQQQQQQHHH